MVLVKSPSQDNPIAVIFLVVVGRGEAYEIDLDRNSSKRAFSKNVPVPDWGHFKIISGSPGAHLKQNFEISPLGHLPDPKIQEKTLEQPFRTPEHVQPNTFRFEHRT